MSGNTAYKIEWRTENDTVEVYEVFEEDSQIVTQDRLCRINIGYFNVDFVVQNEIVKYRSAYEFEHIEVDQIVSRIEAGEEYDPDDFEGAFGSCALNILSQESQYTPISPDHIDDITEVVQNRLEEIIGQAGFEDDVVNSYNF